MAYTIIVTNAKGGVGKTTISTNISHILALGGKKILHIDLDPQGSGTTLFTPYDQYGNPLSVDDIIAVDCFRSLFEPVNMKDFIFRTQYENVDVVPNAQSVHEIYSQGTMDVRFFMSEHPDKFNLLRNNIEQIKEDYDFIIIDGQPSMNISTKCGIMASDAVLTPAFPDIHNLKTIDDTCNMIDMCSMESGREIQYLGFFLNNVKDVKDKDYLELRDYYLREAAEYFVDIQIRWSGSIDKASSSLTLWLDYALNYTINFLNPCKDLLKLLYHEFGLIDEECKENLINLGVKPKFFD